MQLTPQQSAILEASGNLVINAVAGSGKTTTLVQYAASRPAGSRILYLAFNASVKAEARLKFEAAGLSNVKVETAHSLAYAYIISRQSQKIGPGLNSYELAAALGIETGDIQTDYMLAGHVRQFMGYWCNSAALKVQDLNYRTVVADPKAHVFVNNFYDTILQHTREALGKMNNGQLDITHDFYLKKFQLACPQLPFDYILFDEGQDASAAMLDVFLGQKATKVIVGDMHQQIYGWRFAVNSLQQVDFPVMPLSKSFRFNDEVALVANNILRWKHEHLQWPKPVKISGSDVDLQPIYSKATIGRSNLALMGRAIDNWQSNAVAKVYFEGNINSYTFADEGAGIYDILSLFNGRKQGIRDKLIASMDSMDDLADYIEETDDTSLGMLVEVVKKYGSELPRLISALKEQHTEKKEDANMIYSTVHRCKGMEYDEVMMLDDFMTEEKLQRTIAETGLQKMPTAVKARLGEEINIAYVAATRAKKRLHLPVGLNPFKTVQIFSSSEKTAVQGSLSFGQGPKGVMSYPQKKYNGGTADADVAPPAFSRSLPNSGKPWAGDDDRSLKKMFTKTKNLKLLASQFGRSQTAIKKRLEHLGLIETEDGDFQY